MVGINVLNQSARERVLRTTQHKGIGTLCMFAVRRALSHPEMLRKVIADLAEQGLVDRGAFNLDAPLDFLKDPSVAASITEAAYRFCRWEPGLDVILSGTGNIDHLRENAKSINGDPLPDAITARLRELFEKVDTIAGN